MSRGVASAARTLQEDGLEVLAGAHTWTASHLDLGEAARWQMQQKALRALPRVAWRQRLMLAARHWQQSGQERVLLQLDGVWHVVTGARILQRQDQGLTVLVQQCATPASALLAFCRGWLSGRRGLQAVLPMTWHGQRVTLQAMPGNHDVTIALDGRSAVELPLIVTARPGQAASLTGRA